MMVERVELQQAGNEGGNGGGNVGENASGDTVISQQPYDTDKVHGDNAAGGEAMVIPSVPEMDDDEENKEVISIEYRSKCSKR